MGPKKVWGWNDGTDHLYHQTTHVGVRGWSVMFFTLFFCLFVYNARTNYGRKWHSFVIQEEIASVFVGRLRWSFRRFYGEEKLFPVNRTDLKIVVRWRYDWCANARDNFQNLEKGWKVCVHHFGHLEARWKKSSTIAVYPIYCRRAPV